MGKKKVRTRRKGGWNQEKMAFVIMRTLPWVPEASLTLTSLSYCTPLMSLIISYVSYIFSGQEHDSRFTYTKTSRIWMFCWLTCDEFLGILDLSSTVIGWLEYNTHDRNLRGFEVSNIWVQLHITNVMFTGLSICSNNRFLLNMEEKDDKWRTICEEIWRVSDGVWEFYLSEGWLLV